MFQPWQKCQNCFWFSAFSWMSTAKIPSPLVISYYYFTTELNKVAKLLYLKLWRVSPNEVTWPLIKLYSRHIGLNLHSKSHNLRITLAWQALIENMSQSDVILTLNQSPQYHASVRSCCHNRPHISQPPCNLHLKFLSVTCCHDEPCPAAWSELYPSVTDLSPSYNKPVKYWYRIMMGAILQYSWRFWVHVTCVTQCEPDVSASITRVQNL